MSRLSEEVSKWASKSKGGMPLKTFEEYIGSLKKLRPTAYMFGEKIEDPINNPRIRAGINATGATYELANEEKYRELFTANSSLTGDRVNRFTLTPQSTDDLVKRVKINRILGGYVRT
jgi:4-hydroxybutyryl-CoA dehydratase/vinylacetyl-CoA-Delta-isomerase